MFRTILFSGAALLGCAAGMAANAPLPVAAPTLKGALDYERDLYPILKANCIACHNKTTTKADLNMETPDLMKKGGESGAGLVAGKAADSAIFQAAVHTWESPMPPKGNKVGAVNLKPEELGLLKRWIDEGAKGTVRKTREIAWQPLPAGLNPIYASALTADGRWAACSRANQIWIYDLGTRQLVTKLTDEALIKSGLYKQPGVAHRDLVQSLAFSPDGLWLASGSFQEIKLWRRDSPKPVAAKATVPAGSTTATSADGKRTAAAGADGVIKITDATSKAVVLEIRSDLAAATADAATQWEISRQQLETTYLAGFIAKTEAEVKALGDRRKKAQDAIAAAKKAIEEKKKAVPAAETAKAAADKELQAAKLALAGKTDAALDKKAKEAQEKFDKAAKDHEAALAAVKTAEGQAGYAEAEVKDIDGAEAKAQKVIADAKAAQDTATKALAAAKAVKPAAFDAAKDAIAAVAFSADGTRLAAVTVQGTLKVWGAATGTALALHAGTATGATVPSVAAAPDGGFLWTQPDGSAWGVAGGSTWALAKTLGGGADSMLVDRVNALRFSPDGKLLAAGSGEPSRTGDVTLWDPATGKLVQTWLEKHHDSVLSLDFSPDGKWLATGAADKAIRVSEVPSGKQVRLFEGHTHHVLGVAFRADGRVLASAGADNVVKIWDMITGDRRKNVEGWDKEVTSVQFLGATDSMITSAGDNRLRIVKEAGTEVRSLGGLPDFMFSSASTRLGDRFIGGGQDSILRVWEAEKGTELAQFKAE